MTIPLLIKNEIGVFAWYEHGLAFTDGEYANLHAQLSGKSSESPDEYYDGTCVYPSHDCCSSACFTTLSYNVRIRKDGFILIWQPNDEEAGWDFDFSSNPPLSQRQIQNIMSAAGVSGFNFVKCFYHNFNYPNAAKVRWFGKTDPTSYFYYTVHVELTVYYEGIRITLGMWDEAQRCARVEINGSIVQSRCSTGVIVGYRTVDEISALTKPKGEENAVYVYVSGSHCASRAVMVYYVS